MLVGPGDHARAGLAEGADAVPTQPSASGAGEGLAPVPGAEFAEIDVNAIP